MNLEDYLNNLISEQETTQSLETAKSFYIKVKGFLSEKKFQLNIFK